MENLKIAENFCECFDDKKIQKIEIKEEVKSENEQERNWWVTMFFWRLENEDS